jgi:hypothetical protein
MLDHLAASVEKFDCMDQKNDFVYLIVRCNQRVLPTSGHTTFPSVTHQLPDQPEGNSDRANTP